MHVFQVLVFPKAEILDVQGRALEAHSQNVLQVKSLQQVAAGKAYRLCFQGELKEAQAAAEKLARELLTNNLSETSTIKYEGAS